MRNFIKNHKRGLKRIYIIIIVGLILFAIYSIHKQTSLKSIKDACGKIGLLKTIIISVIGILAVTPMVIYDFVYTRKTKHHVSLFELLKNSFIINTMTNAGGGGGMIGINLRMYLFGGVSKKLSETLKVVTQIATFTMIGLCTNDALALVLNIPSLTSLPFIMKLTCGLCLFYVFIPFLIPTNTLNRHDHLWLVIGSSLEWLCALGFFLLVGTIIGIHFAVIPAYLVVCFAGIIGAISFIPGGLGSFDVALILGMHLIGISTNTAIAWALLYRIGYYIIPFVMGLILLLITFIHKKLSH